MIGLELRRSQAPWTAGVIMGLGTIGYFGGANLGGGWAELAWQQRAGLGALWALACGLGASQARRERRRRLEELMASTALPRHRRVLPTAVAMGLAGLAGYFGLFVVGAVHLVGEDRYFPPGVVPTILIGALALVAALWVGLAIGSRLGSPLIPPLLTVAGFAVIFVFPAYVLGTRHGADPGGALLLYPTLSQTNGMRTDFVTLTGQAQLVQLVWLTAVAGSGLILFAVKGLRGIVASAVPALAGLAVALTLVPQSFSAAYAVDRGAVEPVCTPDPPVVCVTRVHADDLARVLEPVRRALAVLTAKLGADAPVVALEDYENSLRENLPPQPSNAVVFAVFDTPADELTLQVLYGVGTRPCPGTYDKDHTTARLVAAAWLLGIDPPSDMDKYSDVGRARQVLEHLRGLPPDEQRARILALRRAELDCAPGNRLEVLAG
ncbi:MAG TPA: hypothetical protein VFC19_24035 [Candidatus Limnocylindrales bacterium]|nr:hypothetical protein [Candidatus Limnocylindrales bacterium]